MHTGVSEMSVNFKLLLGDSSSHTAAGKQIQLVRITNNNKGSKFSIKIVDVGMNL